MATALALAPGATLADLGCGMGGPGLWIARETQAHVVGIDISTVALDHARARARAVGMSQHAQYAQGAFADTGLDTASVDGAISCRCPPVRSRQAAPPFTRFARILRPGARLALVCFELEPDRLAGVPILGDDPVADYRPLLEQAAFEVERYEETPDWHTRVTHTYKALTTARPALTSEMGEGGANALLGEITLTLQLQPYRRRVLVVAKRIIEHGFRLPSAADNRPLQFEEVLERVNQVVFLSATPGPFELQVSTQIAEQIVRPTGLVDPEVIVKPTKGQIDDLIEQINGRVAVGDRVLVTTLTKKMAEDLTDYLLEQGLRVRYLHSNVDTIQRIEILRDLRLGEYDVLVGINLLREGLDLPEVSLVAILDADKEGFLRSETSLIQTIGRAARHIDGQVIMYADQVTDSMRRAISETQRRRQLQLRHNEEHGIDPQSIRKAVTDILSMLRPAETAPVPGATSARRQHDKVRQELADMPGDELRRLVLTLEEEMHDASAELRFEYAARLRDEIKDLKRELRDVG